MPRYLPEPKVRPDVPGGTACLLINLGTPDAPTAPAVRRYLKEFLGDPRVVELPRALWWLILNGIILNVRPKQSAKKYASIWTPEGSPLRVNTERQAEQLQIAMNDAGLNVRIDVAMRYGQPSIASVLSRLKADGYQRILLLPLYPQYAGSTTATVFDAAFAWATETRNQPEFRTIRSFADDPGYIAALAARVRAHWTKVGPPGDSYRLLMSFHGIPRATVDQGDPYAQECLQTGAKLAAALGLTPDQMQVTFQSRFGRAQWLQPYTAETLATFGKSGLQRVDVICPGFTSDCLETLEEIAIEGKATFLESGGKAFHYIPCLNDSQEWIQALADIAIRHLQGWPLVSDKT
ncbi:ferrochelatase [Propionivibrio dicarboxylicus]|uniref:Ferrochelatase n=1 Tax=Propionivibrio dicarboxylicus TaxID=83767 RepID=A0A1G7XLM5_9RHOO|nr:ferrochelatase [Propionivibrio dicarboxylicus]SDG85077.1 ferrochelatase [Propionivibrio dicarboxylicus]